MLYMDKLNNNRNNKSNEKFIKSILQKLILNIY